MANRNLNANTWKGHMQTAPTDTFIKIIDASPTRDMLKIINRSHDHYLKIAFSESDAFNDICIPVCPDGFMDQTTFIPTNEIWVAGEGADVLVNWWTDARENIKF